MACREGNGGREARVCLSSIASFAQCRRWRSPDAVREGFDEWGFCSYNKLVIEWDERKRATNLAKHGLDFADAWQVYESPAKITFESARRNEIRKLDVASVEGVMLAFVCVGRGGRVRAISLRRASRAERRMYEKAIGKKPH